MKPKSGIVLLWILVFLLGGVAGAVGLHLYREYVKPAPARVGPPKTADIVNGMTRELKLDDQQKELLKGIFERSIQRYRALGRQYKPQWEQIRNETDEEIKQILKPDQRAKYEVFLNKVKSTPPKRKS